MPAAKVHLTLAFLGEVDGSRVPELGAVAAALAWERFVLRLDEVGSFRRARVAWAGTGAPPAALTGLQAGLEAGLRAAGFALDDRPFAPHVTLARSIRRPVPRASAEAIEWPVAELALVASETGAGRYATLMRWPPR